MNLISIIKRMVPPTKYWPKFLHRIRVDKYFYKEFGRHVDFKNPKTFNEKIQWYMIYYRDPMLTYVTDKVTFKDYVKEKIGEGYTAKLLGVWDDPEKIDFSQLKPPYVLKSNCSCQAANIKIIKDDDFDKEQAKTDMKKWLNIRNTCCNASSSAYFDIKPKILAEEYVETIASSPIDYKFYCFDGVPYCAYTAFHKKIEGENRTKSVFGIYDTQWNDLHIQYGDSDSLVLQRPKQLDEMLRIAKILSKGFPFMRVDFYDCDDKPIVGEMTYDSGWGLKPFKPESFDYELGSMFKIK